MYHADCVYTLTHRLKSLTGRSWAVIRLDNPGLICYSMCRWFILQQRCLCPEHNTNQCQTLSTSALSPADSWYPSDLLRITHTHTHTHVWPDHRAERPSSTIQSFPLWGQAFTNESFFWADSELNFSSSLMAEDSKQHMWLNGIKWADSSVEDVLCVVMLIIIVE